jgi:hypothetical protein
MTAGGGLWNAFWASAVVRLKAVLLVNGLGCSGDGVIKSRFRYLGYGHLSGDLNSAVIAEKWGTLW